MGWVRVVENSKGNYPQPYIRSKNSEYFLRALAYGSPKLTEIRKDISYPRPAGRENHQTSLGPRRRICRETPRPGPGINPNGKKVSRRSPLCYLDKLCKRLYLALGHSKFRVGRLQRCCVLKALEFTTARAAPINLGCSVNYLRSHL